MGSDYYYYHYSFTLYLKLGNLQSNLYQLKKTITTTAATTAKHNKNNKAK